MKLSQPVFSTNDVFDSPGHSSFTKVGQTDWIVYHTSKYKGSGWERHVLAQPFAWNEDGSPNFGSPLKPKTAR